MKTCNKCHKTFKDKEYDSEKHIDLHTPYRIEDEKVRLSGADQIRLLLKDIHGSWENYISKEKKLIKIKGDYDYKKALRLRDFEQLNKIEFVVCGDNVESYREMENNNEQ